MSLRSSTLYVEPLTVRRLLLVAKLYPEACRVESGMAMREKTADERADAMLNEAIKEKFPKVIELEKELSRAETEFIEKVRQK